MAERPVIGVLSPLVGGFYFGGILSGARAAAARRGVGVLGMQMLDAGSDHGDQTMTPRFDPVAGGASRRLHRGHHCGRGPAHRALDRDRETGRPAQQRHTRTCLSSCAA